MKLQKYSTGCLILTLIISAIGIAMIITSYIMADSVPATLTCMSGFILICSSILALLTTTDTPMTEYDMYAFSGMKPPCPCCKKYMGGGGPG